MTCYQERVLALAAIEGLGTRAAAIAARVAHDAPLAVDALEELVRRAAHGDGRARDVLLAFAHLRARGLPEAQVRALATIARERERALAAPLFHLGARTTLRARREPWASPFAHRRLRVEGLFAQGARVATASLRDRVLADPRVEVVARVLAEAPLELRDVLRIASRRPAPAEVLVAVARDPRWIRRLEVREALVANPFTPTWLALALLPTVRARASGPAPELRAFAHALSAATRP